MHEKALLKHTLRCERGDGTALLGVPLGLGRGLLQPFERFGPAVDESAEILGGNKLVRFANAGVVAADFVPTLGDRTVITAAS